MPKAARKAVERWLWLEKPTSRATRVRIGGAVEDVVGGGADAEIGTPGVKAPASVAAEDAAEVEGRDAHEGRDGGEGQGLAEADRQEAPGRVGQVGVGAADGPGGGRGRDMKGAGEDVVEERHGGLLDEEMIAVGAAHVLADRAHEKMALGVAWAVRQGAEGALGLRWSAVVGERGGDGGGG